MIAAVASLLVLNLRFEHDIIQILAPVDAVSWFRTAVRQNQALSSALDSVAAADNLVPAVAVAADNLVLVVAVVAFAVLAAVELADLGCHSCRLTSA